MKRVFLCLVNYVVLSLILSLDNFLISSTIDRQKVDLKFIVWVIFSFTFFHTIFPFIGNLMDVHAAFFVSQIDHWICFAILIYMGIGNIKNRNNQRIKPSYLKVIALAIGCSLDSLFAGFSLSSLAIDIGPFLIMIALISVLATIGGILFNQMIHVKLNKFLPLVSGVVLILIGLKVLVSHIMDHQI